MKKTLKTRLIIISVISVLIPLLIFATIFYIMGYNLLVNDFKKRSIENLYLVDQAVTLYIEKIKHTVNTISNYPVVRDLDSRKLYNYKNFPVWTKMTPYKNTEAEKNVYEYLKLIHINNPDLGAVYIGTDSGGFTMHPTSHRRPYYNPSERPWFKEASKMKGQLTITSPFKSSDANYNIFAVAKQVYFPNSKEYGVVSANIELSTITYIIDQLNIGETGFVMLTKKDGTIIANPADPSINFKNLTSPEIDKSYSLLAQMGNAWNEITINHKKYIVKRNYSVGTEWIFYFLITKAELLEPLNQILFAIIILCIVAISVFTPLAVFTTIKSLVPLDKLNKHLFNLYYGSAELNKRININVNDEVGETIGNFNLFSEKLNNLFIDMKETTNIISKNISEYSHDMLFASTEIEKTNAAVKNIDNIIVKISDLISNSSKGKNTKDILDRMSGYFDELKEYMSDIKSSNLEINSSINTAIEHCSVNKKILKDIRKQVSKYKTRPAAESNSGQPEKQSKK